MSNAYRSVDRFVCYSHMERQLYARHFDLDINRIDMIHWAAAPPRLEESARPIVEGDYLCAIGSQGRDYATLVEAMRTLPSIKLVIVATPRSMAGLNIPANVEVKCNVPLDHAMNVLRYSRFVVVPLLGSEVPCGHVTIVSAMHSKKAIIVSASSGVVDYIQDGSTGITVPVRDALALARAIELLWADPLQAAAIGLAAQAFARERCSENAAVAYLESYLDQTLGDEIRT